jgi:phosphoribosyl 1,2-cyclic phosphodiesterase
MSADLAQGHLFPEIKRTTPPDHSPSTPPGGRRVKRSPGAALQLCVLGSGSGGNSTAVRFGDDLVLLDAGFGPRTIARRLDLASVSLESVRAICLTHLDQDHFRPHWIPTLLGWRIPVHLHRWHVDQWSDLPGAMEMREAGLVHVFNDEPFEPAPGLRVSPIRLAHDTKGTSGFRLETGMGKIGYATDLGHVPAELVTHFTGVDLLAIESNYDPPMQLKSARPLFLKRRIMGHAGHLSNQQAFEAVCQIVDRSPPGCPRHIVLLHRSRQCNCPTLVREVFSQDQRVGARITLSEQRRRTRWFPVVSPRAGGAGQLRLF